MADVLVDTDVFLDHLRGARPLRTEGRRLHYSVITRPELFSGTRGVPEAEALPSTRTEEVRKNSDPKTPGQKPGSFQAL